MNTLSSSVGVLALLEESDPGLQARGLELIHETLDSHWTEVTEGMTKLSELAKEEEFGGSTLAALILSKLYFFLGEFKQSVKLALVAGKLFKIDAKGDDYVDKIIEFCVDEYITVRRAMAEDAAKRKEEEERKMEEEDEDEDTDTDSDDDDEEDDVKMEEKKKDVEKEKKDEMWNDLEIIVNRMFETCFLEEKFEQALGIAIECRRMDVIKKSITRSKNVGKMLQYCLECTRTIKNREFRHLVLQGIVEIAQERNSPDYFMINECMLFLGDYKGIALLLVELLTKLNNLDQTLIGYQIAFDLQDTAPQEYITGIKKILAVEKAKEEKEKVFVEKCEKVLKILDGDISVSLYVDFLYRRNFSDINILNNMKSSFERNSILHRAVIQANAFMYCGTTVDTFLGRNLKWLAEAKNWEKFSATACLGVIHKGQFRDSLKLLYPYLPKKLFNVNSTAKPSIYSEGGALYGVGLIHCTHTGETNEKIKEKFQVLLKDKSTNFVVQHGCCLGLGLTCMGSQDMKLVIDLKDIIQLDHAVSGEAAALCVGLVLIGSGKTNKPTIIDLLKVAKDTNHEKIIRGCAIGIGLICYGREEESNWLIDRMKNDEDPILRYGAMYLIGLSYCGTGNDYAIKVLLEMAVSDVSDDVRRAAVINLGFILFHTPEKVPRLLSLLSESFNPHVRYGVAMALGVSCAGTGNLKALELLDKLLKDTKDYVRQGCYISAAMILMQSNDQSLGGEKNDDITLGNQVKKYRTEIEKVWKNRGESMARMGAVLASGIIDAGGRNVTITCHKNGHNKMRNIIGLSMFTHYWFWYPLMNFLSLAMEPTAIIGLNNDLAMPHFKMKSNAKKSLFAYPEPVKVEKGEKKKLNPLAILSQQMNQRRRRGRGRGNPFSPFSPTKEDEEEKKKKEEEEKKKKEDLKKKEEEEKEEKEAEFQILENPARCTFSQQSFITFNVDDKLFVPMRERASIGITLLKHLTDKQTLVEMKAKTLPDKDLVPPKPFEYPLP